jgi:hypothetical protein
MWLWAGIWLMETVTVSVQIGQREGRRAVAAEVDAEQREQRRILRDRQQRAVAQVETLRDHVDVEGDGHDLPEIILSHVPSATRPSALL